jgi:hypothetical protein
MLTILFLHGCSESPGEHTLGEDFVESQTDIALIDTFSVELSTVILDTVVTSGTGNLLVGTYQDDIVGKITSHSYFQIGSPDSLDDIGVRDDDEYDSLSLIIRYNNYSFGDTTQMQRIMVHQLNENIEFVREDIITGKTSFSYGFDPIGSVLYTPVPNSSIDTLEIRISDRVGLDLFAKLRDNSETVSNSESFINYFHGLVLVPDDMYGGVIVGFSATENDVRLILHTSRTRETAEKIRYTFQRNELSENEIGGLAFLQGGIS